MLHSHYLGAFLGSRLLSISFPLVNVLQHKGGNAILVWVSFELLGSGFMVGFFTWYLIGLSIQDEENGEMCYLFLKLADPSLNVSPCVSDCGPLASVLELVCLAGVIVQLEGENAFLQGEGCVKLSLMVSEESPLTNPPQSLSRFTGEAWK